MRNPVPLEVEVVATGARPSEDPAAQRELFSETTSTVLVFENGAVIRLSAAVASGQLLFLTNQQSRREVVAQVTRKRNFRPTSCYVELEFTEPAAGFWGIEFPANPEPAPLDSRQSETVELVQQAEVTSEILSEPATAPSSEEVDGLKREVEGLRQQLQSLLQSQPQPAPAGQLHAAQMPVAGAALEHEHVLPTSASTPTPAESSKEAAVPALKQDLEESPSPQSAVAHPSEKVSVPSSSPESSPRESFIWSPELIAKERKARAGSRVLLGVFVAALLVASAGAAIYMHWIPLPWLASERLGSPAANAAMPVAANSAPNKAPGNTLLAGQVATGPRAASASGSSPSAPVSSAAESPATLSSPNSSQGDSAAPGAVSASPASEDSAAADIALEKPSSVDPSPKHSLPHRGNKESSRSTGSALSSGASDIVPPRLLHSVRPVPPPEAVQDFVTGNVKVDALVDAFGHVKSVSVLGGPESLRGAAIAAVKQYTYAPATQNSKAVSAHVTVSVQFWYEP